MYNFNYILLFSSPHKNGFLLFVLGIFAVLSVYHFLLFFQQKDRSYLLYSLYTLLLLIAYIIYPEQSFLKNIPEGINSFLALTHQFWVWAYNIVYFYFVLHFLDFKTSYPKENKILLFSLNILWAIGIFLLAITVITQDNSLLNQVYANVYTKVLIVITLYGFYLVAKIKKATKYLILCGSFFLFLGSLAAILIIDFEIFTKTKSIGFFIFYVTIILENICFSLALGLKQKLISIEKNKAQKKLIKKLEENKELKKRANNQLKEKVKVLNKQIKLKNKIEDLKLTILKSQIKPHFIFNALNSIQVYINKSDIEKASHYLIRFSKLIRKILEVSSLNYISLEEELEIIKLYLEIENTRFTNPIETTFIVDKNIVSSNLKVPSLILQTFVENAIWHGLGTKKENKKIEISITKLDEKITINILDNGIGRKASKVIQQKRTIQKKSLGVQIVKDKLTILNPNENNIKILDLYNENEQAIGTKVVLELYQPKKTFYSQN